MEALGVLGFIFGSGAMFFWIVAWSQISALRKEFENLKKNFEKFLLNEENSTYFALDWISCDMLYVSYIISGSKQGWDSHSFYCIYDSKHSSMVYCMSIGWKKKISSIFK